MVINEFLHIYECRLIRRVFLFSFFEFFVNKLLIFLRVMVIVAKIFLNFFFEVLRHFLIFILHYEFIKLLNGFNIFLVNIFIKKSNFLETVRKNHNSKSLLDSINPETSIDRAINPIHLTIAISLIIIVCTLVFVSTYPEKFSISIFHVTLILSLVHVINFLIILYFLFPFALTILQTVFKLSSI